MGPLAGILAGDLAAAQEIPGGLFADVAEFGGFFIAEKSVLNVTQFRETRLNA